VSSSEDLLDAARRSISDERARSSTEGLIALIAAGSLSILVVIVQLRRKVE
jgi:hypothetical protein